ncbi:unnamed protein product [Thelazia callipaeda]|uniref:proline--tRNA ligase n=1 Tax=Thelazia callipaeda TaxID=103827 RepID=A0A158RBX0_THECL|nr:unnamed protein product [Thelazia callipaeda]
MVCEVTRIQVVITISGHFMAIYVTSRVVALLEMAACEVSEELEEKIKAQGEIVRKLKSCNLSSSQEEKQAAIEKLLELKAKYKELTGDAYKTDQQGKQQKKGTVKNSLSECVQGDTKKQTKLGVGVGKSQNCSEWYAQVITKAEMIEYYDVSGCYVLRPWSYAIWEFIQEWFSKQIKKLGVENCYFPIFVSQNALEKEKTHINDFAPEVAWVTRAGQSDLAEPVAIRPTSETVMYPSYSKWIQSHRDLPLKLNQWCNVVRWEFKHPTPFLRTREFLWQEGHTAFQNKAEAEKEVFQILDLYAQIYTDLLAIPVIKGRKTEKEKFAGGDFTTTVEAYVPINGRGIQGATSHHLGQNFSKMFDISFENPDGSGKAYAWQNSWGISTRTIGAVVMIHGDDSGLVLPPRIAAIQIIIVPVGITSQTKNEQKTTLIQKAKEIKDIISNAGIRTELDARDHISPGWKFNHWELKGVPIRIEIGPRDLANNQVTCVIRHSGDKRTVSFNGLACKCNEMLDEIHNGMYNRALEARESHKKIVLEWDEFRILLDKNYILLSPFCGRIECEDRIKKESARDEECEPGASSMGAKTLCIPLEQPELSLPNKCINTNCSETPKFFALFGRSLMSELDSDFDEEAHSKLIDTINNLGRGSKQSLSNKQCGTKVDVRTLVNLIHSTKNVDDVKKKLEKKKKKKRSSEDEPKTLLAPSHRLLRERIESSIAYSDIKHDLEEWVPLVKRNRLAEQLVFPLDSEPYTGLTAKDRVATFQACPRTPMEIKIAELLGTSKNNLRDDEQYTEAELELLRAMNLKQAKEKFAQLQKMRALVSYREAKLRRQAKIKSKSYHRHLKRQKRKKLIKEFEELMIKNPEAAKKKLEEIDRQRILERATLKHRNGGKKIQHLARYASKNKDFKKTYEDQIRLGRELVEKHGREKDSSSDSENESCTAENLTSSEMLEKAADVLREQELETGSTKPELRAKLFEMRQKKQEALRKSALQARNAMRSTSTFVNQNMAKKEGLDRNEKTITETNKGVLSEKQSGNEKILSGNSKNEKQGHQDRELKIVCNESKKVKKKKPKTKPKNEDEKNFSHHEKNIAQTNGDVQSKKQSINEQISSDDFRKEKQGHEGEDLKVVSKNSKKSKKKKSKTKKLGIKSENIDLRNVDVDKLFEEAEKKQAQNILKECRRLEENKEVSIDKSVLRSNGIAPQENSGKMETSDVKEPVDISLDPRHFLQVETASLPQISTDYVETLEVLDGQAENQAAVIAEAFEDVDVIGDFENEKEAVESSEAPKDIDLTLHGWGSWTGPGIIDKKKESIATNSRFVVKVQKKKRKDSGKTGLIISEAIDPSIEKIQLKSVPFPFTTVEDYEAVVRQPLGKEWNPQKIHRKLIRPQIVTKAGRIIKPLDKAVLETEKVDEDD